MVLQTRAKWFSLPQEAHFLFLAGQESLWGYSPPQFLHFSFGFRDWSRLRDSLPCSCRRSPLGCTSDTFLHNFTVFTVLSWFSNSFASILLNSRALSAFMRSAKSRLSRRALCRKEFDWQLRMICSLVFLYRFAKSQVFARLLRRVLPFVLPDGSCKLRMLC